MLHRGPEGLLHHLPALVVRRPVVSTDPTCSVSGMRGSRLLDRRPPHYRCPAVPGPAWRPGDPDGVSILRSSLWCHLLALLLVLRTARRPCDSATPSAASPVARPASAPAWNPTAELPGTRAAAWRLYRGTAGTTGCAGWRPLITAGDPVRSPAPSPSCNQPGFGTPSPHRPANYNYGSCCRAVRLCPALLSFLLTRETITTPQPNVYLRQHRFSGVQ